jgi:hypothetical protein
MADQRSPIVGYDLDTGGGVHLVQGVTLRLSAGGGPIEAIGQMAMASSIPVVIASDQSSVVVDLGANNDVTVTGTVTADTELPAAAALTDNFATPTAPAVGAFNMVYDGAAWDMLRGTSVDGVLVNLGANNDVTVTSGAITADTELPAAAALTDNFANPTAPAVGAFLMLWDGANWDRSPGNTTDGILVNLGGNNDVTVTSGAITADTELPAAAALADATANPTVPGVSAFLMGWNGTTWDRVDTANTGRLQVDVVTGGGADTPTTPVNKYVTSAALAAGGNVNLDTGDIGAQKLSQVEVWSSVAYKALVYTIANGTPSTDPVAVGGGQSMQPFTWKSPHRDYAAVTSSGGVDGFRVNVTNLDDANAADVYATFHYQA